MFFCFCTHHFIDTGDKTNDVFCICNISISLSQKVVVQSLQTVYKMLKVCVFDMDHEKLLNSNLRYVYSNSLAYN